MSGARIRELRESEYPALIGRVDEWWGRPVSYMLPRLFLRHFHATSLAATEDANVLIGFLVGIVSPSEPGEAHAHFIAVCPDRRRAGLGRTLYETFFALVKEQGCRTVTAVVSPVNTGSQRFHLATGFTPVSPERPMRHAGGTGGLPVWRDWDGPGEDRIRFSYAL